MGKLYICATPIGNLEDITLRALKTLKEVDLIACEDTRRTKILLDKYGISKPLTSYHKFNIKQKDRTILSMIKQGKDIALVSDAGMPGISDPGEELIKEAIEEGILVVPIPGPSAFVSALAASGLSTGKFIFQGFLPPKKSERAGMLKKIMGEDATLVFYEAPHRILETLEDIKDVLGERRAVLAREITKKFEEFIRGSISELIAKFRSVKPKGEFVIVVEGKIGGSPEAPTDQFIKLAKDLVLSGVSKKDVVKLITKHSGLPKNRVYDIVIGM